VLFGLITSTCGASRQVPPRHSMQPSTPAAPSRSTRRTARWWIAYGAIPILPAGGMGGLGMPTIASSSAFLVLWQARLPAVCSDIVPSEQRGKLMAKHFIRRWFQFGVLDLLILTTIVAVVVFLWQTLRPCARRHIACLRVAACLRREEAMKRAPNGELAKQPKTLPHARGDVTLVREKPGES
jgi:hypothetical protein